MRLSKQINTPGNTTGMLKDTTQACFLNIVIRPFQFSEMVFFCPNLYRPGTATKYQMCKFIILDYETFLYARHDMADGFCLVTNRQWAIHPPDQSLQNE